MTMVMMMMMMMIIIIIIMKTLKMNVEIYNMYLKGKVCLISQYTNWQHITALMLEV